MTYAIRRADHNRPRIVEFSYLALRHAEYHFDAFSRQTNACGLMHDEYNLSTIFEESWPGTLEANSWADACRDVLQRAMRPIVELYDSTIKTEPGMLTLLAKIEPALRTKCADSGLQVFIGARQPNLMPLDDLVSQIARVVHVAWPATLGLSLNSAAFYVLNSSYSNLHGPLLKDPVWQFESDWVPPRGRFHDHPFNAGMQVRVLGLAPGGHALVVSYPAANGSAKREFLSFEAIQDHARQRSFEGPVMDGQMTTPRIPPASPPASASKSPPLAGYAAAHAELLGVTPDQYRAALGRLPRRSARRKAYAQRAACGDLPRSAEDIDLSMSARLPRGKGIGRELPYDPEEP